MSQGEPGRGRSRGRGMRQHRNQVQDPDVKLSKALSFVLRHGAAEVGLNMSPDGFVFVDDLLSLPRFRCHSIEDLQRVVETNDKQRYAMCPHPDSGRLQIRANQGHSIPVEHLELTPIHTSSEDVPVTAVHGTYLRNWNAIQSHGLSRMNRTHIHLAPGLPGQGQVVSGMRKDCDLAIFVDLQQALKDGIPFFWSANRVILTPGNSEGLIPPLYFSRALQLKHPRTDLPLN
ncbi:tRNA 2'-phosphotransferase 1 [Erpetoichthys calabaricus]|uniref:2'-phosphotransferase n=1 Tax=Erpetoichthys calabaricus TaxID=27687 RepID=A0A8C4SED9_ERPCA|nr:tRNA 2'-phosphotransferase 1 [Erpetoichthys calabaricus]XP_028665547.1 tRNA 2'-phosphotransferase 1 [Erpetoichthys calabaricus]XP_028665557.1 tRNA 2'-phosphotransferase 1 [Erpetoichthys calabaricus]XP_028665566.1 tRNA 2'-phosphotransferase 1 [Erpetoichthys calabaricus]XP_028665573.1 tRNA 2'-phosphotransferase 1 [Erpetoichthys calabaricus]XP_028665580.1 tRNA 2'-phosphotransferase 1 [Erpetoichthys calabaricus]